MKPQPSLRAHAEAAALNAGLPPASNHTPGVPTSVPEIDAKINAYIAENPKDYEYFKSQSQERLVRMLVLKKIEESERKNRGLAARQAALSAWLEQSPELKAQVYAKLEHIPLAKQQAIFIKIVEQAQQYAGSRGQPLARPPELGLGLPPAARRESALAP
jgi:hypothetical protein